MPVKCTSTSVGYSEPLVYLKIYCGAFLYLPGLPLSFESRVALNYTPVTKLLFSELIEPS